MKLVPPIKFNFRSINAVLEDVKNDPDHDAKLEQIRNNMSIGDLYGDQAADGSFFLNFDRDTQQIIDEDCLEYPHLAESIRREWWLYLKSKRRK